MTITITLPPATEERLRAQAEATGKDIGALVVEAVEARLSLAQVSIKDILAPVHRDLRQSGLTDGELDTLLKDSLKSARSDAIRTRRVSMIAAVFDCMVFLQAATSDRGPAFACLSLVESSQVALALSPAILAEVRDVLSRPKIRAKFPSLTPERVDVFLIKLASMAVVTSDAPDAGFPLRDPDDLPYLNLAIATGASYLVTRDPDLLDLMKDAAFLGRYSQLQVVDPVVFLQVARPRP